MTEMVSDFTPRSARNRRPEASTNKTRSKRTLLIILGILALLALIGVGAWKAYEYMYFSAISKVPPAPRPGDGEVSTEKLPAMTPEVILAKLSKAQRLGAFETDVDAIARYNADTKELTFKVVNPEFVTVQVKVARLLKEAEYNEILSGNSNQFAILKEPVDITEADVAYLVDNKTLLVGEDMDLLQSTDYTGKIERMAGKDFVIPEGYHLAYVMEKVKQANILDMYFDIVAVVGNKNDPAAQLIKLYTSPMLQPGQHVLKATLDQPLPAGTTLFHFDLRPVYKDNSLGVVSVEVAPIINR